MNNRSLLFRILSAILLFPIAASAQWNQVNNGITDLSQGAAVLGRTLTHVFAKAGSSLYRSTDNGDTWTAIDPPIALNPTECGYLNNARYFAGMNASTACIFYSDNNGDSWTEATGAPTATVVRGFYAYGSGTYAYTSNAGIYLTADGGTSWQPANDGLTNLNVVAMASYGPYLLASTIGGGIFLSANGGNTWSASNTGLGGDLSGENLWAMNDDLYYTAQGGGKYRSFDLGATWVTWTGPAQLGLGLLEVKRSGPRLYIEARHFAGGGLRDSLYVTDDEGVSWTNITGNLNAADLSGSGILENEGCVFLGYNIISPGQGIYRNCGSTSVADAAALAGPAVFPNPTSDGITVHVPEDLLGRRFRLLDITGAEVLRGMANTDRLYLGMEQFGAGCYLLRWDDTPTPPVRVVKR